MDKDLLNLILLVVLVIIMIISMNLYNQLRFLKSHIERTERRSASLSNKMLTLFEDYNKIKENTIKRNESLLQRIRELEEEVVRWKNKSIP